MRYTAIDRDTNEPKKLEAQYMAVGATARPPDTVRFEWLPRIRCNDCPGKVYTAGPGITVENFVTHLKNRLHKERVEQRRRAGG